MLSRSSSASARSRLTCSLTQTREPSSEARAEATLECSARRLASGGEGEWGGSQLAAICRSPAAAALSDSTRSHAAAALPLPSPAREQSELHSRAVALADCSSASPRLVLTRSLLPSHAARSARSVCSQAESTAARSHCEARHAPIVRISACSWLQTREAARASPSRASAKCCESLASRERESAREERT